MAIKFCANCGGGVVASDEDTSCPVCGSEVLGTVTPGKLVPPAPAQSYYRHVWTLKAPFYNPVQVGNPPETTPADTSS